MSMDIIVKKGLDLKLVGKPSNEIEQAKFSQDFAVYPADFHGVFPKLVVKENDSVKAGDILFFDKNSEKVKFVSPVSGKIKEIVRGERRRVLEIKIHADKEITYKKIKKLKSENSSDIIDYLLENGLWTYIKQRPYDVLRILNLVQKKFLFLDLIRLHFQRIMTLLQKTKKKILSKP